MKWIMSWIRFYRLLLFSRCCYSLHSTDYFKCISILQEYAVECTIHSGHAVPQGQATSAHQRKTHACWQESNFIRLSTRWRSFRLVYKSDKIDPSAIDPFRILRVHVNEMVAIRWNARIMECINFCRVPIGTEVFLLFREVQGFLRMFDCWGFPDHRFSLISWLSSSFLLTDVHFANAFIRIVLHEGQNVLNWESLVLRDSDVIEGSILNGIPTSSRDWDCRHAEDWSVCMSKRWRHLFAEHPCQDRSKRILGE